MKNIIFLLLFIVTSCNKSNLDYQITGISDNSDIKMKVNYFNDTTFVINKKVPFTNNKVNFYASLNKEIIHAVDPNYLSYIIRKDIDKTKAACKLSDEFYLNSIYIYGINYNDVSRNVSDEETFDQNCRIESIKVFLDKNSVTNMIDTESFKYATKNTIIIQIHGSSLNKNGKRYPVYGIFDYNLDNLKIYNETIF